MKRTHCPQCGSERVHRSRRRSAIEYLAGIAGRVTRCHECGLRSLQAAGCVIRFDTLKRVSRSAYVVTLSGLAALFVLTVILWLGRIYLNGPGALLLRCSL